ETGPFTQVPLPGNRSSLVWVEAPERARDLAAMDDAALSIEIERKMQSMLGRVTVEPGRQVYPLSATLPRRFGQNRIALVGEAAPSIGVERKRESMLGRVTGGPGRQGCPLSATLPRRFGQTRIALVGEAAHVFPPSGAQGLNLGLRDVQDLVRVVRANPDDP